MVGERNGIEHQCAATSMPYAKLPRDELTNTNAIYSFRQNSRGTYTAFVLKKNYKSVATSYSRWGQVNCNSELGTHIRERATGVSSVACTVHNTNRAEQREALGNVQRPHDAIL